MAERRFVKCMKCGCRIDKREYGWEYNEKSRRYTCDACVSNKHYGTGRKQRGNNRPKKTFSAKGYKICGIIMKVLGIIIVLMSLLLMIALLPVGIAFAIMGVLYFVLGVRWTKKAKTMSASLAKE